MTDCRCRFMNTYIDDLTLDETISHIEKCISEKRICQVITLNVDQIVRIEKDAYFKKICESCELLLVDGHPLLWIAQLYGRPFKQKICGSDLMPVLCELSAQKGYSVFILGAAPGVADRAATILKKRYPSLKVAGTYSPPWGFEKDEEEIQKINQLLLHSKADMLFVGMGVPKQDRFIFENKNIYKIPVSISVGGTIDFIAGEQKRAPKWISNIGFEWLYRLLMNPKRLFKRYILEDTKIIKLIWKYRRSNV